MTPRVLALVGELNGTIDGCSAWRIFQPFAELQKQGYAGAQWGFMKDDRLAQIVDQFHAVIVPRHHWLPEDWGKGEKWCQMLQAAGIAVIYEMDDDMMSQDFINRLITIHGKDPEKAQLVAESTKHTLSLVDGVTVSSQRLASLVRRYTDKPVVVVPNFIDLPWFTAVQKQAKRQVKGLTIGWAGGARPDYDVEQMAIAWGRLAARFPHVTFVVQGHQAKVIYDNVSHERIAAVDWLPIDQYPAGMINIDIGCCPLADTHFNRAKTYIKAMEYAAGGAAVVASPTVYDQIIQHGHDGYLCQTADEWETALVGLVESANHRNRIAQRLTSKIESQHSLEANAWRWPVAWAEIISDFQRRRIRPQIVVPARYGRERVFV